MAMSQSEVLQDVFVTGLKNAHGVEHQALALIDRQLDHLANYPEVEDMLRRHRGETEQQIVRLEEILGAFGTQRSILKDLGLSLSGNMAALAHVFAPDEILKNHFANTAFENFEAAAYRSLITLAEAGSFSQHRMLLEQSLEEERRMVDWAYETNAALTLKYVERRAAGETASH